MDSKGGIWFRGRHLTKAPIVCWQKSTKNKSNMSQPQHRGGMNAAAHGAALCCALLCITLCHRVSGASTDCIWNATASGGVVMSDSDGSGPRRYSNNLNCSWQLQCAADEEIAISLEGDVEAQFDSLSFKWSRRGKRTLCGVLHQNFVLPATSVAVTFRTGNVTKHPGFTLTYQCLPRIPETRTLTQRNGTLMSDPDGGGDVWKTRGGSAMAWVIECPQEYNAINITANGDLMKLGAMVISWRGYEGSVCLRGDVSSHFVADAGRAVVSLSAGPFSSRGVTLHFECTALNGTSSVTVTKLMSPSGIIMSDADGASFDTYYAGGTLSRWLVSCPNTTRYIELNVTSFLGVSDDLTVVPIRDELPRFGKLISFTGNRCTNHTVAADKMLLQLQGRSGGPGFTLHYTCIGDFPRPPAPGSPLVCGSTVRKPSETLISDPDGCSWTRDNYRAIEWVIECPNEFNAINITTKGDLTHDAAMIVSWRGYEGFVPLAGKMSRHFIADAGRAVVSLSAGTGHIFCPSVTLRYECTVWNGGSSVAVTKLTSPSGIITSDADGASSDTYYAAGTLSQWLVSCPETTRYIELNVTSFLGVNDDLTVVPIRNEVPDLAGLNSFSGYRCTNHTVAADKMLLQLQGLNGGPGFTLHYMCIGDFPRPPAPGGPLVCEATVRKSSGTLMSDPDGISDDTMECRRYPSAKWVIECPQEYNAINITATGAYLNGGVVVSWRAYEGFVPVRLTRNVSNRFMAVVADAGTAVVSVATRSFFCRHVTLRYNCTALNGTSSVTVTKLTSPSGIIMSDTDGASSDTYYAPIALSQWLVTCPETTRYIEVNLTSFLGINDELIVVSIREVPYLVSEYSFLRDQCSNFTVAADKMLLQLQGRSGGPGFTLHYTCIHDSPLTPGSPLVCESTLLTKTLLLCVGISLSLWMSGRLLVVWRRYFSLPTYHTLTASS